MRLHYLVFNTGSALTFVHGTQFELLDYEYYLIANSSAYRNYYYDCNTGCLSIQ